MSLNKFMHPRNKYRKPPDFKALAIKYPEFRKHAEQHISGKVNINFKNLDTLRALTSTLLKEDFGLDVEIPLTRLIPTLPLRLNYLLWIEDILEVIPDKSDPIMGIDIGCGASCVYPLLAAKQFKWHMLGTEVDTDSAFIASNNVRKNNLQHMIKVRMVEEGTLLEGVLKLDTVYDFCMCNPPFFSSEEELDPQHLARSPNRPPPRNAHSGTAAELVVPGGETAFVEKLIQDSVKLKTQVRVYSVMLGHKTSVAKVKEALKVANVEQTATSEFCQGRTTRWGVAWTLDSSITLPQTKERQSLKKNIPFSHTVETDLVSTVNKLQQLLIALQITYVMLKNNEELCAMEITALSNTWSNSRKKRRQEKFKETLHSSVDIKEKEERDKGDTERSKEEKEYDTDRSKRTGDCIEEISEVKKKDVQVTGNETDDSSSADKNHLDSDGRKRSLVEEEDHSDINPAKRLKSDNFPEASNVSKKEPLFHGTLKVKKSDQGTVIELNWLRGPGGRDAAHKLFQYLKNNLKTN